MKPIATTFALVGLYLVNERNYTGKQVQQVHIALAKKSKAWSHFPTPKEKTWITIKEVTQSPDNKKQELIKQWSKSVWKIWKPEKEKIVAMIERYGVK